MAKKYPPIPKDPKALDAEIARIDHLVKAGERDAPNSDDFTRGTMFILLAENKQWLKMLTDARTPRTAQDASQAA